MENDYSDSNSFQLTAIIHHLDIIRYTPAGIPVLELILKHESWQEENNARFLVKFELPAKIIGQEAEKWQHKHNIKVHVKGFLAQRNQKTFRPVLRIQNISEIN